MNVPTCVRIYGGRILLLLCPTVLFSAEPVSLDTVEKSAGEWLKVRAETSRLETEWSSQRELLESTVHGLTERAQTLEAKRDYLKAKTAKDRGEIDNLESSGRTSSAGLQAVDAQLEATGTRLLALRRSLPPRLSASLELPYKSLSGKELPLGERMQLTITMLNRCLQFNRSIVCEDEVVDLDGSGGNMHQMEVIYWGLSHGYALDRAAGKAWYGSPGVSGWRWEAIPDAGDRVAKLISIYRGKGDPEFIEMPVTLTNGSIVSSSK